MDNEEIRRQVIASIVNLLEQFPFTFEYRVKEKPKGIRVVLELTKDEFDNFLGNYLCDTQQLLT